MHFQLQLVRTLIVYNSNSNNDNKNSNNNNNNNNSHNNSNNKINFNLAPKCLFSRVIPFVSGLSYNPR